MQEIDQGDRPEFSFMKPNLRRCTVCRKIDLKQSFWRVVRVYPSQQVQLDQGMGRSAYLCQSGDCLNLAKRKDRLGRSLKKAVPREIYLILEERLKTAEVISCDS